MMFTIYERACAEAELQSEELSTVLSELNLPSTDSPMIKRSMYTYVLKMSLINDKQKALDNIMGNIDKFTSSTNDLINKSYDAAESAFRYRLQLELAVLESQLKSLEIELLNLKNLSVDDFFAKYG